jgi:hypothetical protein
LVAALVVVVEPVATDLARLGPMGAAAVEDLFLPLAGGLEVVLAAGVAVMVRMVVEDLQ